MTQPIILNNSKPATSHTQTIPDALEASANASATILLAQGDKDPQQMTMRELLEKSYHVAQQLLDRGLERGGRVIIMLPTSEAWLTFFYGTLLAGGVPVPVGPTFSFGGIERYLQTVKHIAIDAGAQFFVGGDVVEPHIPFMQQGNPALKGYLHPNRMGTRAGSFHPLPSPDPNQTAILQYTSGTTSMPKGVMLSHRAMLANAYMIGERVDMTTNDFGVSWLPLFHDMGLIGGLITALHWRYPLLLMSAESFLMHPRRWLQAISRYKATMSVAPNFAYQMVLDRIGERHSVDLDLSRWRCAFNGSEAVRTATVRSFLDRFGPKGFKNEAIRPVYGMAENTLAATFPPNHGSWVAKSLNRDDLEAGRRVQIVETGALSSIEIVSVGTPLCGVSVRIANGSGEALASDSVGEIQIKSPSLMDGYFRNETKSRDALCEGFLRTGDLGFIHDGELFITGRAKELIIKRGRNYYPDDLELVAEETGKRRVLRAAAFSCDNELQGTEDIVLVLEIKAQTEQERELLEKDVNGALLAAFGIRADVLICVAPRVISRTTSGKVQRTALRARYLAGELVGRPL